MNRDNQPTFNVNRKIANFSDFGTNKEVLKKDKLQTKPNSEDQQHIGNDKNEFDPITRKVTQVTPDEVKDKLDAMDKLEESLSSNDDLEEAAKIFANKWYKSSDELSDFLIGVSANSFKHGAKWQAERFKK